MQISKIFFAAAVSMTAQAALADVTLYSLNDCSQASTIAVLKNGQTASSCHAYAVQNNLENVSVLSSNFLPGYCSIPMNPSQSESFEQACVDFAGQ